MKNFKKGFMIVGVSLSLLVLAGNLTADDDYGKKYSKRAKYQVKPVNNQLYKDECASCHFGYQPGLLPSKSWSKLMEPKELANHFGDDASLEESDRVTLLNYLRKNASDKNGNSKIGSKIARSISWTNTPIAISKTRYFQKEHDEIPKRLITQKEVKTIGNCVACHTTAKKGYYGERDIKIPNYGRWDD